MEGWQHRQKTQTKYEVATECDRSFDSKINAVPTAWPGTSHLVQCCCTALPVWSLVQSDLETVLASGTSSPKPVRNQQIFREIKKKRAGLKE